jgi:uncharacterized protein involved in exopolysaccharide biosynthesis
MASPKRDEGALELITSLVQRKNTIAKFTIVGTLLAAVISLLLPVRYSSTTVILPPQQGQSLASLMVGQLGALAGLGKEIGLKSGVDLYAAMLASESVETGVVRQFKLMDVYHKKYMTDARNMLRARTTLKPSLKQGTISLSVQDPDPKRAADLANGYVEQLHVLNQRLAIDESSQRRVFFENQLRMAKDNLTAAEQKMKETQQKTGMLQLDVQARAIIQSVGTLKGQIAGKEVQLQAMRSFATGKNPDYIVAEQQLEGLQEQLAKLLRNQNVSEGDIGIPTSKVPESGLAFLRAYRDLRYQEAMYEVIAKQYEAAKLDEAKSVAFAQVIDPATIPERKYSPHRTMIVICGFLVSFLLGCAFIKAQEACRRFLAEPLNRERVDLLKLHLLGRALK